MRNNRTAGHNYERQIVNELLELGFEDIVTSRAESRNMDNRGVDIFQNINDSGPFKVLPIHIQCKNYKGYPKYEEILESELLPKGKPTVIFHKKTKKAKSKFVTQGEFVIMKKSDFYNLINK